MPHLTCLRSKQNTRRNKTRIGHNPLNPMNYRRATGQAQVQVWQIIRTGGLRCAIPAYFKGGIGRWLPPGGRTSELTAGRDESTTIAVYFSKSIFTAGIVI